MITSTIPIKFCYLKYFFLLLSKRQQFCSVEFHHDKEPKTIINFVFITTTFCFRPKIIRHLFFTDYTAHYTKIQNIKEELLLWKYTSIFTVWYGIIFGTVTNNGTNIGRLIGFWSTKKTVKQDFCEIFL